MPRAQVLPPLWIQVLPAAAVSAAFWLVSISCWWFFWGSGAVLLIASTVFATLGSTTTFLFFAKRLRPSGVSYARSAFLAILAIWWLGPGYWCVIVGAIHGDWGYMLIGLPLIAAGPIFSLIFSFRTLTIVAAVVATTSIWMVGSRLNSSHPVEDDNSADAARANDGYERDYIEWGDPQDWESTE